MSPAPADLVNAAELAGRAATLERSLARAQSPRLAAAGVLDGTQVRARLAFGKFDDHVTIEVRVEGEVVVECQRCLRPCRCMVDESASLAVVARDADEVPGGYEPLLGNAERLSLTELIEEQVLLGLPLVPMHADAAQCGAAGAAPTAGGAESAADEMQRPFANLRELLDKGAG